MTKAVSDNVVADVRGHEHLPTIEW